MTMNLLDTIDVLKTTRSTMRQYRVDDYLVRLILRATIAQIADDTVRPGEAHDEMKSCLLRELAVDTPGEPVSAVLAPRATHSHTCPHCGRTDYCSWPNCQTAALAPCGWGGCSNQPQPTPARGPDGTRASST